MTASSFVSALPALGGRLAVVTGSNRGLGFEIVTGLVTTGAEVVMACRDLAKAEAAIARLRLLVPKARVSAMVLDVADLASVRRFATQFGSRYGALDLLFNNAAAIMAPQSCTRDGFEMHLGTNHFGPFALTGLLLERLDAAPAARIINTASLAHRLTPGLDPDDPALKLRSYQPMDAYGRSKLAALLFTFELERRLRRAGSRAIAVAAHPGYAATNVDLGGFWIRLATRLFAQPAAQGAWPALQAATALDVLGGDYYGPGGFKELRGRPRRVDCRAEARDPMLAQKLWALSERLSGVQYLND